MSSPLACEKTATCMHAKQLIGTDVAAFAWQKHVLKPHPHDGWRRKQCANAVPIGVHVSQLELQGLIQHNTVWGRKAVPLGFDQREAQG